MGPGVGLGSSCLFVSSFSSLPFSVPASAFARAFLLSSSVLVLRCAFSVSPFCCRVAVCFVFVFVVGVRGGSLFVSSHLLKRVRSPRTGASQHALAFPPSCPLSVLLLLACLSVGWYMVVLGDVVPVCHYLMRLWLVHIPCTRALATCVLILFWLQTVFLSSRAACARHQLPVSVFDCNGRSPSQSGCWPPPPRGKTGAPRRGKECATTHGRGRNSP